MARPKIKADRFEALEWISHSNVNRGDECFEFEFDSPTVRFMDKSRAPCWISCFLIHGPTEGDQHPVQICKTPGCINGRHFKWGTYTEKMRARVFPSRRGEANPTAKFTDLEVAQLKSVRWGNGRWKKQVAEIHGVSIMTLNGVISGKTWSHIAPYVSAKNSVEGDEF